MLPYALPYAYVRRSALRDGGDKSRAFQTEEVRRLAGDDAHRLRIIDSDWGRSGATDKTDKREAFLAMLEDVEAGKVSALYAYSADRLARSVEWAERLRNACRRAGVPIVTTERRFEPGDDGATMQWQMWAMMNENYSSQASKKRLATVKVQRAAGVRVGSIPYGACVACGKNVHLPEADHPFKPKAGEDRDAVLAAFDKGRSFNKAARILNDAGVPSRRGHILAPDGTPQRWSATTVGRIVRRARPEVKMRAAARGSRTISTRLLSRLVICPHDSSIMAAVHGERRGGYICRLGRSMADHPRPFYVVEASLLPWIREQTDWYDRAVNQEAGSPDRAALAAIAAERKGLGLAQVKGLLDDATIDAMAADLDARERDVALGQRAGWYMARGVDWSAPPGEINASLRGLWKGIVLDYGKAIPGAIGRHTSKRVLVPIEVIPQPTVPNPHDLAAAEAGQTAYDEARS